MISISYREHKTNDYVWQQVIILADPQELLSTVKRRKLSCSTMSVTMIRLRRSYFSAPWTDGITDGGPRKSWKDNINEWTG